MGTSNPFTVTATPGDSTPSPSSTGYRPSQWSQPALTVITVPSSSSSTVDAGADPITGAARPTTSASSGSIYVFDAVFRTEHTQELRKTEHPVQTGASIVDHAYLLAPRVVMEIGMSDVMDSYQQGMWGGSTSKSVSAFQTLLTLQRNRTLFTLTTRLNNYANMLIDGIQSPDTAASLYGLKATVVLSGIFVASVDASGNSAETVGAPVSARPDTTDSTQLGPVKGQPVPQALQQQHQITTPSNIPGAGNWSSNKVTGNN